MDGGAWYAAVHGFTKSRAWLSNFTFAFHFHALEKEMATHSGILSWEIPWAEEPGRLQSPWGCEESDTTEWAHMYKESTLQCAFQFFDTLSQVGKKSFWLHFGLPESISQKIKYR